MAKFVNSNGDEINADVVLWSGSHFGYVHDLTFNDDALIFKELIIISDDSAVIAPIIDREIIYSGVVNNWTVTSMSFKYNQASKLLHIDFFCWFFFFFFFFFFVFFFFRRY